MARPFLVASLDAEGSILVMMMAKLVGFATVENRNLFGVVSGWL